MNELFQIWLFHKIVTWSISWSQHKRICKHLFLWFQYSLWSIFSIVSNPVLIHTIMINVFLYNIFADELWSYKAESGKAETLLMFIWWIRFRQSICHLLLHNILFQKTDSLPHNSILLQVCWASDCIICHHKFDGTDIFHCCNSIQEKTV